MALAYVNNSSFLTQSTTSTTITLSYTPVHAGDLLIVGFVDGVTSFHIPTIADTNVNAWSADGPSLVGSFAFWKIFYAPSCKAGATMITVTTSSTNFRGIYVTEVSGADTSSPLDVQNAHESVLGSPGSWTSNSATTNAANEFIYGFCGLAGNPVVNASFGVDNSDVSNSNFTGWKIVSSIGSYSFFGTSDSGTDDALMATFRQAGDDIITMQNQWQVVVQ